MYKAIISDLDGTLLDENHKITGFTVETVNKVVDKGIKFYIATGRNYKQAKTVMDDLGLTIPMIVSNGARVCDRNGEVIYENKVNKKEVDIIFGIDYAKYGEDIILNVFSGDDWIIEKGTLEKVKKNHPELRKIDAIEIEKDKLKDFDILKFFFVGKHDELIELEKEILEKTRNNVTIAFVSEVVMEVFNKTANKANAAKFLLKREGIDIKDTVSFGDGENDFELLTEMGKGYAMGNAIKRLNDLLPQNFERIGKNSDNGEAEKLIELFLK